MFVDQMRRAIAAAPKAELCRLSGDVWKAFAAGAIGENDAQALAEAVQAKKAVPAPQVARRRVGSRPRTPDSLARRRRWAACGLMPPQVACHFTMAEAAVLAVLAAEVSKRGLCRLTIGHIAALAGCCRQTVRNAVRQAVDLGFMKSAEWRLSAFRSAPNTVTIVSAEWVTWLRLGQRTVRGRAGRAAEDGAGSALGETMASRRSVSASRGGSKFVERTPTDHIILQDRASSNRTEWRG